MTYNRLASLLFVATLMLPLQQASAGPILYYDDDDDDAWGDINSPHTSNGPGRVRLSHDETDANPTVHPQSGPTISEGSPGPGGAGKNLGTFAVAAGNTLTFDVTLLGGVAFANFFDSILPTGATFVQGAPANSVTGTFSWTPTAGDVGTHGFETYGQFFGNNSPTAITGAYADLIVTAAVAVPEPGTLLLLGSALAGTFGLHYRRRKAAAGQSASPA